MQTTSRFPETRAKSRIKRCCGFNPYGPGSGKDWTGGTRWAISDGRPYRDQQQRSVKSLRTEGEPEPSSED